MYLRKGEVLKGGGNELGGKNALWVDREFLQKTGEEGKSTMKGSLKNIESSFRGMVRE